VGIVVYPIKGTTKHLHQNKQLPTPSRYIRGYICKAWAFFNCLSLG